MSQGSEIIPTTLNQVMNNNFNNKFICIIINLVIFLNCSWHLDLHEAQIIVDIIKLQYDIKYECHRDLINRIIFYLLLIWIYPCILFHIINI